MADSDPPPDLFLPPEGASDDVSAKLSKPSKPSRLWRIVVSAGITLLVAVVVAAAVAAGWWLHNKETRDRQRQTTIRVTTDEGLDLQVTAQRVDTDSRQLLLSVLPVPKGSLAASSVTVARDLDIYTPSLAQPIIHLARGTVLAPQQISVPLEEGTASDYPFDHYSTGIYWFARTSDGAEVETGMIFSAADPSFTVRPTLTVLSGFILFAGGFGFDVEISRSHSVLGLALFMAVAMWSLALAVVGGAFVLLRKREGMVWSAMGWMAATLFALVGLRSAAPGSPPIGSLLDYTAFFWSEALITGSLAVVALSGIRAEHRLPPAT